MHSEEPLPGSHDMRAQGQCLCTATSSSVPRILRAGIVEVVLVATQVVDSSISLVAEECSRNPMSRTFGICGRANHSLTAACRSARLFLECGELTREFPNMAMRSSMSVNEWPEAGKCCLHIRNISLASLRQTFLSGAVMIIAQAESLPYGIGARHADLPHSSGNVLAKVAALHRIADTGTVQLTRPSRLAASGAVDRLAQCRLSSARYSAGRPIP